MQRAHELLVVTLAFAPLHAGCAEVHTASRSSILVWLMELMPAPCWMRKGLWSEQKFFPSNMLIQTLAFHASFIFKGGSFFALFFVLFLPPDNL